MAKPKRRYYSYLSNAAGASRDVPMQTYNKNELKKYIRENYSGFTVHLMAVGLDGDGRSVMGEPCVVETFKLRGP